MDVEKVRLRCEVDHGVGEAAYKGPFRRRFVGAVTPKEYDVFLLPKPVRTSPFRSLSVSSASSASCRESWWTARTVRMVDVVPESRLSREISSVAVGLSSNTRGRAPSSGHKKVHTLRRSSAGKDVEKGNVAPPEVLSMLTDSVPVELR